MHPVGDLTGIGLVNARSVRGGRILGIPLRQLVRVAEGAVAEQERHHD